jgi:hypothetical protein
LIIFSLLFLMGRAQVPLLMVPSCGSHQGPCSSPENASFQSMGVVPASFSFFKVIIFVIRFMWPMHGYFATMLIKLVFLVLLHIWVS